MFRGWDEGGGGHANHDDSKVQWSLSEQNI